jgi:hypothetical protein
MMCQQCTNVDPPPLDIGILHGQRGRVRVRMNHEQENTNSQRIYTPTRAATRAARTPHGTPERAERPMRPRDRRARASAAFGFGRWSSILVIGINDWCERKRAPWGTSAGALGALAPQLARACQSTHSGRTSGNSYRGMRRMAESVSARTRTARRRREPASAPEPEPPAAAAAASAAPGAAPASSPL